MTSPHYRFEQFFAVRRTMDFMPSPDGDQVLFSTDISGQFNLWRVASTGGWPEQLTLFDKESVRTIAVARDGSRIAFIADPDGNEKFQVYLMDARGGWPERLTDRDDVQYSITGGSFSPNGQYLAFSGNATNPAAISTYLRDLATGETHEVCGGQSSFYFASFSPDGTHLLTMEMIGNTHQEIWLVDLASGERRCLTGKEGRHAKAFPAAWRKDGSGFYFLTDEGREFLGLALYDLTAGTWSYVVREDWDIEAAALSGDGTLLAYTVNEAGNSAVRVVDLTTGARQPLPAIPMGVVGGLKFAGADARRRLFLWMGTFSQAGAIYVLDLAGGDLKRVTESMLGNIPEQVFSAPELVHIESHDGLKVPAWLYKPQGIAPGQKVPAVLSIHGGPEQQERTGYAYGGFYQYLLSQGVAILAPNIRGSTGFGISYQKRIHRDWGGAELKDIEACARFLGALDWVDAGRLAVWGGSFGGFATLSAATRLPDLWACACDFCGPSNLVTFAKSVPPHWKPIMKGWVGDPDEDFAMLMERSPITYVENIKCPLMVVQGATDPRVVKAESDQMVERLRSMGREVEYLVFEDEGHGFAKRSNQLKGFKAMADFLLRYLAG